MTPPTATNANVWDAIFVDSKPKKAKKTTNKVATAKPVKDIDVLKFSYGDRQMLLSKKNRVRIYAGDYFVIDMSKPLFRATSEIAGEILKDNKVKLPADVDQAGVVRLVDHLENSMLSARKPVPLTQNMTMSSSLGVCVVGQLLGMNRYVGHIYKKCEARLRRDPPTYEELDAIIAYSKQHTRLFNIVVNDLATRVWDDTIPDPEDFKAYLAQNPALENAIKVTNDKYANKLRIDAEREARRVRREEQRARLDEQQKRDEERKKKEAAADKAFWTSKKAKDAALEASCQKKMKATNLKDRKFTVEERLHYVRTKGKQPPKGC